MIPSGRRSSVPCSVEVPSGIITGIVAIILVYTSSSNNNINNNNRSYLMFSPRVLSTSSFSHSDAEYFRFIHVQSSCVLAFQQSNASKNNAGYMCIWVQFKASLTSCRVVRDPWLCWLHRMTGVMLLPTLFHLYGQEPAEPTVRRESQSLRMPQGMQP